MKYCRETLKLSRGLLKVTADIALSYLQVEFEKRFWSEIERRAMEEKRREERRDPRNKRA